MKTATRPSGAAISTATQTSMSSAGTSPTVTVRIFISRKVLEAQRCTTPSLWTWMNAIASGLTALQQRDAVEHVAQRRRLRDHTIAAGRGRAAPCRLLVRRGIVRQVDVAGIDQVGDVAEADL